jgi:hypothetical protein
MAGCDPQGPSRLFIGYQTMSYIPNILWIGALAVAMFAPANLDAATSDDKKRPSRDAVIETFLQVAFTDQASDEWQHARRWPPSVFGNYSTART